MTNYTVIAENLKIPVGAADSDRAIGYLIDASAVLDRSAETAHLTVDI